jgi:glycosyltransferase involved in cell wall biosynthesis
VNKVKRVRHFLRPHIYDQSLYTGDQNWDVLFLVKGNINQDIKFILNKNKIKWTSLVNPWWQPEELEYKAKRSKVCIVGSQWDTWGLAAHEINAFGCPLIAAENGMMAGNMSEGMGIYLDKEKNKKVIGADLDEIFSAIENLKKWSRKDVRISSLDFQDPKKLTEMYKNSLLG